MEDLHQTVRLTSRAVSFVAILELFPVVLKSKGERDVSPPSFSFASSLKGVIQGDISFPRFPLRANTQRNN